MNYRAPFKKRIHYSGGVTLIEILVSLSLFTLVSFISIGALTSVAAGNKQVQSTRIVMDNLSLATESIVRTLRSGTNYHCSPRGALTVPKDCTTNGSDTIAFRSEGGETFVFRQREGRLQRSVDGGDSFLDITAPDIKVEMIRFYVSGSAAGDQRQPRVLMIIKGVAGVGSTTEIPFNLQTVVSQRIANS